MAKSFEAALCKVGDNSCLLYPDGKTLANCVPEVLQKAVLLDSHDNQVGVKITLCFHCIRNETEKRIEYELDIKKLDKLKISEIHPDLYASSDRDFTKYIRWLIPKSPTITKYYIDSLGWMRINGNYVFCTGNQLIGNAEGIKYEIASEISHISMNTDLSLTPEDVFASIWNLFAKCDKKVRLLMMYILGAPLRQLFKDAGYIPKTVVYVEAGTQSGKTTFSQGFGCPYMYANGSYPNYTRISSTQAFVEEAMSFCKDMVYIYDDVYCDSDKRIRRAIEERVKGVLRNAADNAPRNKKGALNQINAQLLLIGEELIDSISNIGRLLVIRLEKKFTANFLTDIRNNKRHINTFYTQYIEWLSKNYTDIVNDIKRAFDDFQKSQTTDISRNFDTRFFMSYITKIFCWYGVDHEFLSEEQCMSTIKGLSKDLEIVLSENRTILQKAAQREAQQAALNKEINYSKVLFECLKNGYIELKEKGSDFFKNTCKGHKCYFIRCDYFRNIIMNYCNKNVSAKALTDYFRIRLIGIFDNNGRIRQYKKNKQRYLVLKEEELKRDAGCG